MSGDAAAVSQRLAWWGTAGLALVTALCLAATFGLAVAAPGLILAVPAVVCVGMVVAAVVGRPGWGAGLAVALSLLLAGIADPIPAGKPLFGLYVGGFLAVWYVSRWASGECLVVSRTDVGAALLLSFGMFGGIALGVLLGNRPAEMVLHVQAFFPVLLYFPLKNTCAHVRSGPEIVAGALMVLGVGASVQNVVLTQQAFASATQLWQIIDARVAYGETMLLASTVMAVALLTSARTRREAAFFVPLFVVVATGLIVTKSRGFWVSTLLGVAVLVAVSDAATRRQIVTRGTAGLVVLGGLAVAVAGQYLLLIAVGIVKRFSTLSTAATSDLSLVNRFAENAGVWQTIRESPVLGHGWGATYTYYSILSDGSQTWGFVHNAYLGIWLKLGLWGLALVAWVWIGAVIAGARAARDRRLSLRHRAIAGAAGAALVGLSLAANTSSPFELADQAMVLTALWALAQGTAQRAAIQPEPGR